MISNSIKIPQIYVKCDHDNFESCDKCLHERCEYCNQIGERKAETFDFKLFGDGPKSIIYYECQKNTCRQHRDYDYDTGKAMAKGEL